MLAELLIIGFIICMQLVNSNIQLNEDYHVQFV